MKVDVIRADLSDLDSVPKVLQEVDALTQGEDVEVVYYNAARIQPTAAALDVSVQEIEEDLRVFHHHLFILQLLQLANLNLRRSKSWPCT